LIRERYRRIGPPGNAINATDRIEIWSNGFDFGCPDAASGAPEDRVRKLDFGEVAKPPKNKRVFRQQAKFSEKRD
jgi:hypothetical protein